MSKHQSGINMSENKKTKHRREKITESPRKISAQLINEITRAEGIMNAIGDGLTILDTTFTVLYENQVHRDMMGDHVGEYCFTAYQKREGICGGCPLALVFADGNVHTVQRQIHAGERIKGRHRENRSGD